jgi:prophage tail gpP-like protein
MIRGLQHWFTELIEDNQQEIIGRLDEQDRAIEKIDEELTYNGGNSTKDIVRKIAWSLEIGTEN